MPECISRVLRCSITLLCYLTSVCVTMSTELWQRPLNVFITTGLYTAYNILWFAACCVAIQSEYLGPDSIERCHLTSIWNPIVEIRWSYDRLIPTMGFPILVRWHLYIEPTPWIRIYDSLNSGMNQVEPRRISMNPIQLILHHVGFTWLNWNRIFPNFQATLSLFSSLV